MVPAASARLRRAAPSGRPTARPGPVCSPTTCPQASREPRGASAQTPPKSRRSASWSTTSDGTSACTTRSAFERRPSRRSRARTTRSAIAASKPGSVASTAPSTALTSISPPSSERAVPAGPADAELAAGVGVGRGDLPGQPALLAPAQDGPQHRVVGARVALLGGDPGQQLEQIRPASRTDYARAHDQCVNGAAQPEDDNAYAVDRTGRVEDERAEQRGAISAAASASRTDRSRAATRTKTGTVPRPRLASGMTGTSQLSPTRKPRRRRRDSGPSTVAG